MYGDMLTKSHLPREQPPIVTGNLTVATDELAAAGYVNNGLYASKDGDILRLTLGYPSGDPRLAAAARTIQRQLGVIGIEVDLLRRGLEPRHQLSAVLVGSEVPHEVPMRVGPIDARQRRRL